MSNQTLKPGWKRWRFDQMAISVNDRIDNPAEADVDYYVGLEHLDTDSLKIRRWGAPADVEATKLRFRRGDIIFGRRRAYQRKLAVADFDGICSAHAMVLRPKTDVVLTEFLPFFMQSDLFMSRALEISVGSLSPTINWKTLATQEFVLPPLKEQRQTATLLSAIEETICVLQELKSLAIMLWRSLSAREFGCDLDTDIEELSNHYDITSGQVDPADEAFASLPLIAPNHIESETGKLLQLESARDQNAISGKYLYESGAVLYSKIRPNLVKATIAPCKGLCSADMYPLLPKASIRSGYLLEILLSDRFTQYAVSGSMRTGMPKLNREHLAGYMCHIPTLQEQDEYIAMSSSVHSVGETVSKRIGELLTLKTSVLKRMYE